ncbi:hypothetical protein FHG87_006906 [Trinorchestia longiramus]|nr:hypothetical protein FHG87_006906 [Trinorchestia longiramus]
MTWNTRRFLPGDNSPSDDSAGNNSPGDNSPSDDGAGNSSPGDNSPSDDGAGNSPPGAITVAYLASLLQKDSPLDLTEVPLRIRKNFKFLLRQLVADLIISSFDVRPPNKVGNVFNEGKAACGVQMKNIKKEGSVATEKIAESDQTTAEDCSTGRDEGTGGHESMEKDKTTEIREGKEHEEATRKETIPANRKIEAREEYGGFSMYDISSEEEDVEAGDNEESPFVGMCIARNEAQLDVYHAHARQVTEQINGIREETKLYNFPLSEYTGAINARICNVILGRKMSPLEKQFVQLYSLRSLKLKAEIIVPFFDFICPSGKQVTPEESDDVKEPPMSEEEEDQLNEEEEDQLSEEEEDQLSEEEEDQLSEEEEDQLSEEEEDQLSEEEEDQLSEEEKDQLIEEEEDQLIEEEEDQLSKEEEGQLSEEEENLRTEGKAAQLSAEKEDQLNEERESQLSEEKEAQLSEEKEAQLSEEKEAQLSEEKEAQLSEEKEAQLSGEDDTLSDIEENLKFSEKEVSEKKNLEAFSKKEEEIIPFVLREDISKKEERTEDRGMKISLKPSEEKIFTFDEYTKEHKKTTAQLEESTTCPKEAHFIEEENIEFDKVKKKSLQCLETLEDSDEDDVFPGDNEQELISHAVGFSNLDINLDDKMQITASKELSRVRDQSFTSKRILSTSSENIPKGDIKKQKLLSISELDQTNSSVDELMFPSEASEASRHEAIYQSQTCESIETEASERKQSSKPIPLCSYMTESGSGKRDRDNLSPHCGPETPAKFAIQGLHSTPLPNKGRRRILGVLIDSGVDDIPATEGRSEEKCAFEKHDKCSDISPKAKFQIEQNIVGNAQPQQQPKPSSPIQDQQAKSRAEVASTSASIYPPELSNLEISRSPNSSVKEVTQDSPSGHRSGQPADSIVLREVRVFPRDPRKSSLTPDDVQLPKLSEIAEDIYTKETSSKKYQPEVSIPPGLKSSTSSCSTVKSALPFITTVPANRLEPILRFLHRIVSRVSGDETQFVLDDSGIYGKHRMLNGVPGFLPQRVYVSKGQQRLDPLSRNRMCCLSEAANNELLLNLNESFDLQDYGTRVHNNILKLAGLPVLSTETVTSQIFYLNTVNLHNYVQDKYALIIKTSPTPSVTRDSGSVPSETEPVSTPTEPVSTPTEPVSTPTEPVSTPTEPVSTPTEPVSTPAEPVCAPAEPVCAPAEPVCAPAEPSSTAIESVSSRPEDRSVSSPIHSESVSPTTDKSSTCSKTGYGALTDPTDLAYKSSSTSSRNPTTSTISALGDAASTLSTSWVTTLTTSSQGDTTVKISAQGDTTLKISAQGDTTPKTSSEGETTSNFSSQASKTSTTSTPGTSTSIILPHSSTATSTISSTASTATSNTSTRLQCKRSSSRKGYRRTFYLIVSNARFCTSDEGPERSSRSVQGKVKSGALSLNLQGHAVGLMQCLLADVSHFNAAFSDIVGRLVPRVVVTASDCAGCSTIIYVNEKKNSDVGPQHAMDMLAPQHAMQLAEYLGYFHGVLTIKQIAENPDTLSSMYQEQFPPYEEIIDELFMDACKNLVSMENDLRTGEKETLKVRNYLYVRYFKQAMARKRELIEGYLLRQAKFFTLVNGYVIPANLEIFATKQNITDIKLKTWSFGHENYCLYDLLCLVVFCTEACTCEAYLAGLVLTYIRAFERVHAAANSSLRFDGTSCKVMMEYCCRRLMLQMLAQPTVMLASRDWFEPLLAASEKIMHIIADYVPLPSAKPNTSLKLGDY